MIRRLSWLVLAVVACAPAPAPRITAPPDDGRRVVAHNGVVTSAHPLASEAGLAMLRAGGNAVDAAVAAGFAIGVVEPEMSGLGGGGAMLLWQNAGRDVEYADFYSSQPARAFLDAGATRADSTKPLREVAIPGLVAGLLEALDRHGSLPRSVVMAPAIRYAREGFPIYSTLAEFISRDTTRLGADPVARKLFAPNGRWLQIGERLVNPELADALERVANEGRDGFYRGALAGEIVKRLSAGGHPASLDDLAAYQPLWKRPLCTTYRGRVVLSAPPPQGGMQLLHSLELLERGDASAAGLPAESARGFDLFASAMRAGTQGARLSGDPRWKAIPARAATSDAYAAARANVIATGHAADTVRAISATPYESSPPPAACVPFLPYGDATSPRAVSDTAGDLHGAAGGETTHISVVDRNGDAVSLTVTNSSAFGSGVAVHGFFLNDSGVQWFADAGTGAAWLTRNSTIAPTMMFEDGRLMLVIGSPGGGRIPLAMTQVISYVTDFGMDALDAIRMPRLYTTGANSRRVEVEVGFAPAVLEAARGMGYVPVAQAFGYARLYLIAREGDAWVGAADPRHDGRVGGY